VRDTGGAHRLRARRRGGGEGREEAMKPGLPVKTPYGLGILLTRCESGPPAWWVLFGTFGRIVLVEELEVIP